MTTPKTSKPEPQKAPQSKNPRGGEGDHASAERYNAEATKFAKSGKVPAAAEEAEEALAGDEAEELEQAEAEGRARAKERDR